MVILEIIAPLTALSLRFEGFDVCWVAVDGQLNTLLLYAVSGYAELDFGACVKREELDVFPGTQFYCICFSLIVLH